VFIGICEDICVPFQTSLTVTVENASSSTADQATVQAAFEALPTIAREAFSVTSIKHGTKTIQIEAIVPESAAVSDLFLAAPPSWQFGAPKRVSSEGNKVLFEAKIAFAPKGGQATALEIPYVLVNGEQSVSGVGLLAK
ncbi:MAG: hypothetical protein ACRCU5_00715, partial [Rhizobiaceae bacterium]